MAVAAPSRTTGMAIAATGNPPPPGRAHRAGAACHRGDVAPHDGRGARRPVRRGV